MISKNKIKLLKSLHQQKYRKINQMYLVEGHKCVMEWLSDFKHVEELYATKEWLSHYREIVPSSVTVYECKLSTFQLISQQQSLPEVILLSRMPIKNSTLISEDLPHLSLVLDRVQDPGNVGTILRTADWFGIQQVVLLKGTVDPYNAKVVQASMGSLLRVQLVEMTEEDFIRDCQSYQYELVMADMHGASLDLFVPQAPLMLVLGNEGQGVSEALSNSANYSLMIPGAGHAESLNVGIAAAIFMYQLS